MQRVVLPAWIHYVVFDLWTGRWEVLDAGRRGVPQVRRWRPLLIAADDDACRPCTHFGALGFTPACCMQILMAVPLFFTLMLGPSGLLLYLAAIRPFFRERPAASKQD